MGRRDQWMKAVQVHLIHVSTTRDLSLMLEEAALAEAHVLSTSPPHSSSPGSPRNRHHVGDQRVIAVKIADSFYAVLAQPGGALDPDRAALALHRPSASSATSSPPFQTCGPATSTQAPNTMRRPKGCQRPFPRCYEPVSQPDSEPSDSAGKAIIYCKH
jgi:hypothetical protein